ncbi:hypothetical protein JXA80_11620 [bacterium]|nr:hypothetical protein [candidate division CSSED10-310 bacterium]
MPWIQRYICRTILCSQFVFLVACRVELHHGLTESQANEILLSLIQVGIDADKQKDSTNSDRWLVTVPEKSEAEALDRLIRLELSREDPPGFSELFKKDGFIPSELQENTRFVTALAGELQKTLESDDSVVKARVHIHLLPDSPAYGKKASLSGSASVFLKLAPGLPESRTLSDESIRKLVANSVTSLSESDVSVVRSIGYASRVSTETESIGGESFRQDYPPTDSIHLPFSIIYISLLVGGIFVLAGVLYLIIPPALHRRRLSRVSARETMANNAH